MVRHSIVFLLIMGLLSFGGLSYSRPLPGRVDHGAALTNPLRFLQAQESSYLLASDASFDVIFGEVGGADQLALVTGLPDNPTIAQTLSMLDVGVPDGVAISPDGDTALMLFWAVPEGGFVTGFAVIRGLSTGTMRREAVVVFDRPPEGEAGLWANYVAFNADGQSAVILRRRLDFPFDMADVATHSKLNVITGLPDAPVIGPDIDIPALFAESFAVTRDGDHAVVSSFVPKGLTLVSGLAPGGDDPGTTFMSLENILGPAPVPPGEAALGSVALTLDEDGVIVPAQNAFLSLPQGRVLVFTGRNSGALTLARTIDMADGFGPWPINIAVHPSGDQLAITEQFNTALDTLSGTLAGDPNEWQTDAFAIGDPFLQSPHDVVFTPDGDTAVVTNTDLRSLGVPQFLGSLTMVTGFNSGNVRVSPPALEDQIHTGITPDGNIATPPPTLANFVSLFTRGKPAIRHILDDVLLQAIEQAGQKEFNLAAHSLDSFLREVTRQQAEGQLTQAQAQVLTTLANLGRRRLGRQ